MVEKYEFKADHRIDQVLNKFSNISLAKVFEEEDLEAVIENLVQKIG